MAKDRALTLEALRVMDAIDRRGSFAAAADELGRVPSALSYTMQKLEEELDVVLFDRSGHRTKFTNVGRMLLERGRVLLEAADKLTVDAEALARGWETHITIVCEALSPAVQLFPLIEKLAQKSNTQVSLITEVLAGAWERLEQGRADIVIAPDLHFRSSSEIYESTHRLLESLQDMVTVWGPDRYVVLARELTKTWENIRGDGVGALLDWVKEDETRKRGEMVLIVEGHSPDSEALPAEALRTLALLQKELPLKKAAALAAEIHGVKKNALYKYALDQQGEEAEDVE